MCDKKQDRIPGKKERKKLDRAKTFGEVETRKLRRARMRDTKSNIRPQEKKKTKKLKTLKTLESLQKKR